MTKWSRAKQWFAYYPPESAAISDWNSWNERFKKEAFIRYVLNHVVDYIATAHKEAGSMFVYWFKFTVLSEQSKVDTGLPRRCLHEADTIMLSAMFETLVNHVEIVCSASYFAVNPDKRTFKRKYLSLFDVRYRDPIAGIMFLQETNDVTSAETIRLYNWWANIRKPQFNKVEYMSGYMDNEDNRMLHRLIDIRGSLWT